uniref:Caspase-8 n=2 Tax=Paramormyrops kingsleyae TaxID=1676925 RepID=A0A3B3TBI7_9TELE|nr:caspase-8-like isoform X1 [Paramormyrops kingsleyae]
MTDALIVRSLITRKRKRDVGNTLDEENCFKRPRQDLDVHRNGAMQNIRANKMGLIDVLMSDPDYILQNLQADALITQREYNIIKTKKLSVEETVIDILDKIMNKGEDTCRRFLTLLQTDDVQETFPNLKHLICPNVPKQDNQEFAEISEYPMTDIPRGLCVIFNNETFTNLKRRDGSQKDADRLREVFGWLGFKVKIVKDQSAEEMRDHLRGFGQQAGGQCFVCCVLSHGTQQGVYGRDGKVLGLSEILQPFRAASGHALNGKPKVFFIQACQGSHMQEAVSAGCDEDLETESDGGPVGTIPCDADFLVGMATVQDCVSLRDVRDGSWYIQTLCRMLEQGSPSGEDIHSILTRVNEEVSRMNETMKHNGVVCLAKQMPEPKYTLTKKLVFRVPE